MRDFFKLISQRFKDWSWDCGYSPHRRAFAVTRRNELNCCFDTKSINCEVSDCFPLQTVAFRGHGFSLLEKPTLRGLQTRAIPAGVNGPPLQTPIVKVKSIL